MIIQTWIYTTFVRYTTYHKLQPHRGWPIKEKLFYSTFFSHIFVLTIILLFAITHLV